MVDRCNGLINYVWATVQENEQARGEPAKPKTDGILPATVLDLVGFRYALVGLGLVLSGAIVIALLAGAAAVCALATVITAAGIFMSSSARLVPDPC